EYSATQRRREPATRNPGSIAAPSPLCGGGNMNSNLENFCPRLRAGRVIPQGSHIIFETDSPYNQIILPMPLADLILLCGGQFSIRQIIEKIYRKQGAVPFKSILRAIHALHQGGFFENGEELILNSHLQSWMEPRHDR